MKNRNLPMIVFAVAALLISVTAQAAGIDVAGFVGQHQDAFSGLALMGVVSIPNGALVHIASGYGTAKTMSALTNASPGEATLESSHGVATGDIIEVTSGWSRLNNKIVRAGTVATNQVPLEGYDTSLTSIYASGGGAGTVREITGWTQVLQILNSSSNGGDQQFLEYQLLEADSKVRRPTFKNPIGMTFSLADDPALAGFILAGVANDDRLQRAVRITLPNGSLIFHNCYLSLNRTPSLTVNEVMSCEFTLSMLNEPVRYTS